MPGGKKSKGPIVALVVAAVLVLGAGVTVALVLSGGDDSGGTSSADGSGSPQDTLAAFAQAWRDKDCEAYDALLTEEFRESEDPCRSDQLDGAPTESGPEIVEESADSATAEFNVSADDGYEASYELTLVNTDGEWLIDDVELIAAMQGPG